MHRLALVLALVALGFTVSADEYTIHVRPDVENGVTADAFTVDPSGDEFLWFSFDATCLQPLPKDVPLYLEIYDRRGLIYDSERREEEATCYWRGSAAPHGRPIAYWSDQLPKHWDSARRLAVWGDHSADRIVFKLSPLDREICRMGSTRCIEIVQTEWFADEVVPTLTPVPALSLGWVLLGALLLVPKLIVAGRMVSSSKTT